MFAKTAKTRFADLRAKTKPLDKPKEAKELETQIAHLKKNDKPPCIIPDRYTEKKQLAKMNKEAANVKHKKKLHTKMENEARKRKDPETKEKIIHTNEMKSEALENMRETDSVTSSS